jgi:hypothetical protein
MVSALGHLLRVEKSYRYLIMDESFSTSRALVFLFLKVENSYQHLIMDESFTPREGGR